MAEIKPILKYLAILCVVLIMSTTYIWLGAICIFIQDGIASVPEVYNMSASSREESGVAFQLITAALLCTLFTQSPNKRAWLSILLIMVFAVIGFSGLHYIPRELIGSPRLLFHIWGNILYFIYLFLILILLYLEISKEIIVPQYKFDGVFYILMLGAVFFLLILYKENNWQFPANAINFILLRKA